MIFLEFSPEITPSRQNRPTHLYRVLCVPPPYIYPPLPPSTPSSYYYITIMYIKSIYGVHFGEIVVTINSLGYCTPPQKWRAVACVACTLSVFFYRFTHFLSVFFADYSFYRPSPMFPLPVRNSCGSIHPRAKPYMLPSRIHHDQCVGIAERPKHVPNLVGDLAHGGCHRSRL